MKKLLCSYVVPFVEECTLDELETWMIVPPSKDMGDYSLPCFQLAKRMYQTPKMIAEELKESIMKESKEAKLVLDHMEVVKGYLNFYLKESWYQNWLLQQCIFHLSEPMSEGAGKTICIDFSSPNIAKNFHIGHLRTTLIGNSLYKIYEKLGYHVVGINHLGDWGTQFGKLIVAYKKWGDKEKIEKEGISELLRLYVLFHEELEHKKELMEEARLWFLKMEQKEKEAIEIWQWFKDISLKEFRKIYEMLSISFDSYSGESIYTDSVPALVEQLKAKNLLVESDGAYVVLMEEENMPPCLITKSDGTSIYPSRDVAAAIDRKNKYDFEQCLYVTGAEQQLHFRQVFQVVKKMGYDWWRDLVHVSYGLVSVQGEKLSSRNGTMVFAKDLLEEAIRRIHDIIMEKNPKLKNKDEVAKQVGIGAVIFHDLYHVKVKNVSFSWEQVLNFDGATAPYIQYTCARANSILRKNWEECNWVLGDFEQLNSYSKYYTETSTKYLLSVMGTYWDVIHEAAKRYEPCVIARFAYELAHGFNQFYQECNIQSATFDCKQARLLLTYLVKQTIQEAMSMLGIECPEEM